jgi:IMP dehydrogenase
MNPQEALTYDDVLLAPQYSDIRSRAEVDLSVELHKGIALKVPIVSAPMDTVSGEALCLRLGELGGLGILHRYNSILEQSKMVSSISSKGFYVGAAIGVTGSYFDRACAAVLNGASLLCVDVAHGHHILVREALEKLRENFPDTHLMAGNIATLDAFNDLADWGADSLRCSVGAGSCCTTRIQTGHGLPGLHTVFDCARSDRDTQVVADGGIRNSGDITKALAAGSDFVMVGSLFAGTAESPGEVLSTQEGTLKTFRGMASKESQKDWRGVVGSLEGVSSTVPYKGTLGQVLEELTRGIRSGLSYSGARTVVEFAAKARFYKQTAAGRIEGSPHVNLIG